MNKLLLIVGMLAFCMGILWVGQGLNYVKWPASSFMVSQVKWSYYGVGLVFVGLLVIWVSRR